MKSVHIFAAGLALSALAAGGSADLVAQKATATAGSVTAKKTTGKWAVTRLSDGHPDLQGVWANNNVTPLERPKELAGRQFLTDEEVAALRAHAREIFAGDSDAAFGDAVFVAALRNVGKYKAGALADPSVQGDGFDAATGNYNQFWLATREFDNRTSMIVDPSDGRIPPLTPEAKARQAKAAEYLRLHPSDGPENRPLSERCITFGVPRLNAAYNSYYHIVQTPDYVTILMEIGNQMRLIPMDGRPKLGDRIRNWNGDSRGHWEGDTLVIETANYSSKSSVQGATENLRVTERLTRVGPDKIEYVVTFNDPATWTRPWTVMIPLKRSTEKIFEYACHEGNVALRGILGGARADEAKLAKAAR